MCIRDSNISPHDQLFPTTKIEVTQKNEDEHIQVNSKKLLFNDKPAETKQTSTLFGNGSSLFNKSPNEIPVETKPTNSLFGNDSSLNNVISDKSIVNEKPIENIKIEPPKVDEPKQESKEQKSSVTANPFSPCTTTTAPMFSSNSLFGANTSTANGLEQKPIGQSIEKMEDMKDQATKPQSYANVFLPSNVNDAGSLFGNNSNSKQMPSLFGNNNQFGSSLKPQDANMRLFEPGLFGNNTPSVVSMFGAGPINSINGMSNSNLAGRNDVSGIIQKSSLFGNSTSLFSGTNSSLFPAENAYAGFNMGTKSKK